MTPGITALAYLGIASRRLDEWDRFATGLLGMQRADRSRTDAAFRMDDRAHRLIVERGDAENLSFLGWEAAAHGDLERIAARLEAHGTPVARGGADLADRRAVADLIVFNDPLGNRNEICWRPQPARQPFTPGRPLSGFSTGELGAGHAVLHVENAQAVLPFYRDLLGFGLSDYGMLPYPVYFLHANARHHSLALVGSGRRGLHHFMVETRSLDDVGQAYDLAQHQPGRVAYTLGRHSNDYMVSFYANAPSDFFVEYGWGGRCIDPATWTAHETTDGPSFWGHDRLALPPELREEFRRMRFDAAARGLRTPQDPAP